MPREISWKLWVVLFVLGLISVVQAAIGITKPMPTLLIAVALNIVLMTGLYLGHRWAFVVTLVLCVVGIGYGLAQKRDDGVGIALVHAVLGAAVFASRGHFWRGLTSRSDVHPLRCPQCGYSLLGLTTPRCPECGTVLDETWQPMWVTGAFWKRAVRPIVIGVLVLAAIWTVAIVYTMQRRVELQEMHEARRAETDARMRADRARAEAERDEFLARMKLESQPTLASNSGNEQVASRPASNAASAPVARDEDRSP